jgi:hypothetical protein
MPGVSALLSVGRQAGFAITLWGAGPLMRWPWLADRADGSVG